MHAWIAAEIVKAQNYLGVIWRCHAVHAGSRYFFAHADSFTNGSVLVIVTHFSGRTGYREGNVWEQNKRIAPIAPSSDSLPKFPVEFPAPQTPASNAWQTAGNTWV